MQFNGCLSKAPSTEVPAFPRVTPAFFFLIAGSPRSAALRWPAHGERRIPRLGSRIDIPGSFWTGTAPADRNRLFAIVVIEQAQNHRFNARTAGPSVRLQQMADLDSDEMSPDAVSGLWMLAKVWHDYEKAHKVSDCEYVRDSGEIEMTY